MIALRKPIQSRRENIVPMINVAFLLLVFFLLTAAILPPPPVELTPPEATAEDVALEGVDLFLADDGSLVTIEGEAAEVDGANVRLHAAQMSEAVTVARVIGTLQRAGAAQINLVATQRSTN